MGAEATQTEPEGDNKDAVDTDRDDDTKAEPSGLPSSDRQKTETVHAA